MVPQDIDPKALKLLEKDWTLVLSVASFVRKARAGEKPGVISFEELDDHQLVLHREYVIEESDRQKGLRWLSKRIAKPNPKA